MSTSYYRLLAPFTRVWVEEGPAHDRVTVWEAGANAGTLTVSHGLGRMVALRFADRSGDPPLRSHWGGAEVGAVVTVNDADLADSAWVVSEYGEPLTVAEVKGRAGVKRPDGMPTELFGYPR